MFYVSAVVTTNLFGKEFPEFFGNLGSSFFTLFQVMTLESWSDGIARPVMEKFPNSWIFFVIFIIIATFVVVNLFVAAIVDSFSAHSAADKEEEKRIQDEAQRHLEEQRLLLQINEEFHSIKAELDEVKDMIKGMAQGTLIAK